MRPKEALFKKFLDNECTIPEMKELIGDFTDSSCESELREYIFNELTQNEGEGNIPLPDLEEKEKAIYLTVKSRITKKKPVWLWRNIGVASAVLLVCSFGGYFLLQNHPEPVVSQKTAHLQGTNKATLTLADGRNIVLDANQPGKLAMQGETAINQTRDGTLIYSAGAERTGRQLINTVSTLRSQQYKVTLPDGSRVWLNAASSIRFPVVFQEKYRKVEITGEVYFEVKPDAGRPFKVSANHQVVEVLGTRFNVNSYQDEPAVTTTLLQGKISIRRNAAAVAKILHPGEEAINKPSGITIHKADTSGALGWKKNLFVFVGSDVKTLMRQLSRWYDLDVVYEGDISRQEAFTGRIPRNVEVPEIIELLKNYHIYARVEGNKIFVKGD